jgi:hypothetical protein
MFIAARYWQSNMLGDIDPELTYSNGVKESLAMLCKESNGLLSPMWRRLEMLRNSHMALLINSLGLISSDARRAVKVPISSILGQAHFCPSAQNIQITLKPIAVRSCEIVLDGAYVRSGSGRYSDWELGGCLMMGPEHQETVDSYMVFRGCSLGRHEFDLLFFDQCKFCSDGGLVKATYDAAIDWCRDIVRAYKTKHEGRNAGFIFGVTNPIKRLSKQLRDYISLRDSPELEFFYGMGREECTAHYANFSEHAVLVPRVYINAEDLTSGLLALALPDEWTYPDERAIQIINSRPRGGYKGWDEVVRNAKIESDSVDEILSFPKSLEETALRFC